MLFYDSPNPAPNPRRVRIFAAEKGIDLPSKEVSIPQREQKAPDYLAKNPAGGQHHVCYEVADIGAAREWFEGLGKRILGPTRTGAHGTPIFFVHPKDMMGQLAEIMETPKGGAH